MSFKSQLGSLQGLTNKMFLLQAGPRTSLSITLCKHILQSLLKPISKYCSQTLFHFKHLIAMELQDDLLIMTFYVSYVNMLFSHFVNAYFKSLMSCIFIGLVWSQ